MEGEDKRGRRREKGLYTISQEEGRSIGQVRFQPIYRSRVDLNDKFGWEGGSDPLEVGII